MDSSFLDAESIGINVKFDMFLFNLNEIANRHCSKQKALKLAENFFFFFIFQ